MSGRAIGNCFPWFDCHCSVHLLDSELLALRLVVVEQVNLEGSPLHRAGVEVTVFHVQVPGTYLNKCVQLCTVLCAVSAVCAASTVCAESTMCTVCTVCSVYSVYSACSACSACSAAKLKIKPRNKKYIFLADCI